MGGPLPLAWADMAHWSEITFTVVRPAEWRILRTVDRAYLAACHELASREQAETTNPNTLSERPMSPELWDAIF